MSFLVISRLPAAALPKAQAGPHCILSFSVAEAGARLREQSLCGGRREEDARPDPQLDWNPGNYNWIYSPISRLSYSSSTHTGTQFERINCTLTTTHRVIIASRALEGVSRN